MARLAAAAKTDPHIRELALGIVRALPPQDYAGEARAVFQWVQRSIRYVRDVRGVETVQTPEKTLEYRQGDCDDMVTLLAALLESIGHEVRFVAMGTEPGRFSHVFAQVRLGGRWVSMDPIPIGGELKPFGWQAPDIAEAMVEGIG